MIKMFKLKLAYFLPLFFFVVSMFSQELVEKNKTYKSNSVYLTNSTPKVLSFATYVEIGVLNDQPPYENLKTTVELNISQLDSRGGIMDGAVSYNKTVEVYNNQKSKSIKFKDRVVHKIASYGADVTVTNISFIIVEKLMKETLETFTSRCGVRMM